MRRFWVGETLQVRADFADEKGADLAVTGVEIRAGRPDGAVQSFSAASDTPASFRALVPLDQPGIWYVRVSCAGPTPTATEVEFAVAASHVV